MICGKIIYKSKQEASDSIAGFNNDRRVGKSKIRPTSFYFCADCGGWHITTPQKSKSKKLHKTKESTRDFDFKNLPKKIFESKHGHKSVIVHTRLNFKVK